MGHDWYDRTMDIMLIVILAVMGALLGSFAVAQVWRLRARQLVIDKRDGEPVDETELRRLKGLLRPVKGDRSECLSCHHRLAWYDLLPVISWLSLGGKCRYCKKSIGAAEILSEVGLALVFVVSYIAWPYPLTGVLQLVPFVLWLIACMLLTILLVYDAKWSLLPFAINIGLIVIGVLYVGGLVVSGVAVDWLSLGGAVVLLGGLYLLFSLIGWVGMGDGILGIGLALFLGNWQLAFLTLFLANLLGCFMLIPLYFRKRLHRQARIPFGPFLIVAAVISLLAGDWLISYLFGTTGLLVNLLML